MQPTHSSFARAIRVASFLSVVLMVAACDESTSVDGLALDVTEPGPFAVGYRSTETSYAAPDGSGTRTIPVSVWYPVDADVAAGIADPVKPDYHVFALAITDAPPATPAFEGGFPVVVHSHGHAGWATQSFAIFEWLAENGFVVIVPDHVGDRLEDFTAPNYQEYFASRYERVFDAGAALDYLDALPQGDPLAGRTNTTKAVLSGHSRGTFTVWAALGATMSTSYVESVCGAGGEFDGGCTPAQKAVYAAGLRDTRFVAGIPMAGSGDYYWFGGFPGMNAVTAPIFEMTGSADQVGADAVFANVTAPPMTWIDYANGCHNVFGAPGCGGAVDPEDAQRTFGTYATAFARRTLFADDDPLVAAVLDGSHQVSPSVTFHAR